MYHVGLARVGGTLRQSPGCCGFSLPLLGPEQGAPEGNNLAPASRGREGAEGQHRSTHYLSLCSYISCLATC